jgi:hypothetical protein
VAHDDAVFTQSTPVVKSPRTHASKIALRSVYSYESLANTSDTNAALKNVMSFEELEKPDSLSVSSKYVDSALEYSNRKHNSKEMNSRRDSIGNNSRYVNLRPISTAKELFHMQLFNPFDIDNSDDAMSPTRLQHKKQSNTFHRRRWAHLHPSSSGLRPTQKAEYIKHFLLKINWQSLTEPACMPLTTDYWPGNSLSNRDEFELNVYTVTDYLDLYPSSNMLLRELVLQRLHEGFQVYVPDKNQQPTVETKQIEEQQQDESNTHSKANNEKNIDEKMLSSSFGKESKSVKPAAKKEASAFESQFKKTDVYLSSATQFHHLTCESDKNIVVTRYIAKDNSLKNRKPLTGQNDMNSKQHTSEFSEPSNKSMYSYKYLLWNSTLNSFENRNIRFCSQVAYNWNKLDELISGFHDQMDNSLHNRCLQFHLIPITQSNMKYFVNSSAVQPMSVQYSVVNLSSSPFSHSLESSSPGSFDASMISSSVVNNLTMLSSLQQNEAENKKRIKAFKKFKETILGRNFRLAKLGNNNSIDIKISTEILDQKQPGMKRVKLEKIPTEDNADRYEWFHLGYESTYHPAEAFRIKVQWLVCSAILISDYVNTMARRAAKLNFALVQTPVDTDAYARHVERQKLNLLGHGFSQYSQKETEDDIHPFRTFVNIPLPSEAATNAVKEKLCRSPFNFFPEHVPINDCQRFVHESGCIVLECGPSNIIWIDNPFHTQPKKQMKLNPLELLQSLQSLCASQELYNEDIPRSLKAMNVNGMDMTTTTTTTTSSSSYGAVDSDESGVLTD